MLRSPHHMLRPFAQGFLARGSHARGNDKS
jgi:hypothetical protein